MQRESFHKRAVILGTHFRIQSGDVVTTALLVGAPGCIHMKCSEPLALSKSKVMQRAPLTRSVKRLEKHAASLPQSLQQRFGANLQNIFAVPD